MIDVRRAADRFRTEQPGITTWHVFSAGAHYDADRIAFGPIVGVDEHVVQAGRGFDWHGHRGVHIASWVTAGTLRHEDSNGEVRFVPPGVLFVQSTGPGIRHTETNASETEPLRFVQITVLGEDEPGARLAQLPASVAGVAVDVRPHRVVERAPALVLVLAGEPGVESVGPVHPGDWFVLDRARDEVLRLDGPAELLVLALANSSRARD